MRQLSTIHLRIIEAEFGKLNTREVIVTEERVQHIRDHHPQDYALFTQYCEKTIVDPDAIIRDTRNPNTIFMVLRLDDINLNSIVRLSVANCDAPNLKNSVMTFYRIRNKNLIKLIEKNKVLYNRGLIWYTDSGESPK